MRFQSNCRQRTTGAVVLLIAALSGCKTPHPSMSEPTDNTAKPAQLTQPAWQPALRQQTYSTQQLTSIRDQRAPEISGLAASNRREGFLWAINDSGNRPSLLAFSRDGKLQAEWQTSVNNRDWEDLASFTHAGQAYLLVAETGDNRRHHPEYQLHVFKEPQPIKATADRSLPLQPVTTLRFVYPDGQHNSEAVAVAQNDNAVIIVTKARDSAGIYSVPLTLRSSPEVVTATRLGTLPQLPQSPGDRLIARLTGIDFAVATALDINPQSNAVTLLTYREVYRWTRLSATQSWGEVLAGEPLQIMRHDLHQAEALTFDQQGKHIYVTSERLPAPVLWLQANTVAASN